MDTKSLIFAIFIHPISQVNCMAGEIDILGLCLLWYFGLHSLLYLSDLFSRLNQPIWKQLKKSTRGQVLSIISLATFHDSSNELPVNFWNQIFWILHLIYKINRQHIHDAILMFNDSQTDPISYKYSIIDSMFYYDSSVIWNRLVTKENETVH